MRKILLAIYLSLIVCSVYGEPVNQTSSNSEGQWINIDDTDVDISNRVVCKIKNGTVYQNVNGKKSICGKIVNGLAEGQWVTYYDNGQKQTEGSYKNGKQDGLEITYYKNGQKESEGTFVDGQLDGKISYWNENGQLEKTETYRNGNLVE